MVAGRRFGPGAGPAALYWAISPHTGTRANLLSKGSHYAAFLRTVGAAVADGRIRYREDITDGFENALRPTLRRSFSRRSHRIAISSAGFHSRAIRFL